MNSHETLKRVGAMMAALEQAKPLFDRLQEFIRRCGGIEEKLSGAINADNANVAFQASQHARNELLNAVNAFKSGQPSVVYRVLTDLETAAHSFADTSSGMGELWLPMITGQLANFTLSLDKYVDGNKVQDAVTFMHAAIELNSLLQSEKAILSALRFQLSNLPLQVPENERILSIYFEIDTDLADLALRLEALQSLYSEVCGIMKIAEVENRLRLAKLEVGSILVILLGSSSALALISWLIKSGLGYMHRNFTTEGKLAAIPKQGEALKSIIDIKKQLEKGGIDTSPMEAELQKSGAIIAGNLNQLLAGVPSAEVDGDQISVGPSYAQKLIEVHKQNLLPGTEPLSGQ